MDAVGEVEMRRINDAGLGLVKEFEQGPRGGPALTAYQDPVGIWTIGWGSTRNVTKGQTITEARAETLLRDDLTRFEGAVDRAAKNPTENEFSAMVSLAYNIGIDAFLGSTVLRKHNAGDRAGAAKAFGMWNKATNDKGKKVELRGLTRRRAAEAAHYLTPTEESEEVDPQRTRAADVVPSADPLGRVAKAGAGVVAAGTVAQQIIVQAADVRDALGDFGVDPRFAMLALAVLVGGGLWYALSRRNG